MTVMQPTILLVEDKQAVRDAVKKLLKDEGLCVLEASNGQDALNVVANQSVDLILLDLRMPQMDGLVFLERFRRCRNDWITPVCVLTAGLDDDGRSRAINLGADDFVQKPIDDTELRVRVRSLLRIGHYQGKLRALNAQVDLQVEERTIALSASVNRLESAHREIDLANRETVLRLALAAEMQNACGPAHLERMSHYSALLAKKCGWSTADVALLTEAAKMHDIGKLGIPDEILNNADKLNKEEIVIMQQHPEIGARILAGSRSDLLKMGAIVALTHHERFDGTGYPKGLTGKGIPQVGRIVAIADAFDALMTRRSRRHAWSIEATAAAMNSEAGGHFDPDLLALFLEEMPALCEIHHRFEDEWIWEHSSSARRAGALVPGDSNGRNRRARPGLARAEAR